MLPKAIVRFDSANHFLVPTEPISRVFANHRNAWNIYAARFLTTERIDAALVPKRGIKVVKARLHLLGIKHLAMPEERRLQVIAYLLHCWFNS